MIDMVIIRDVSLNGCDLIAPDHCVMGRARWQRYDTVPGLTERFQFFVSAAVGPDDSPQSKPCIINPSKIVEVVTGEVTLGDVYIECLRNADGLGSYVGREYIGNLFFPGQTGRLKACCSSCVPSRSRMIISSPDRFPESGLPDLHA